MTTLRAIASPLIATVLLTAALPAAPSLAESRSITLLDVKGPLGRAFSKALRAPGSHGSGNSATVVQNGSGNAAAVGQSGKHNTALVFQHGRNNSETVVQEGRRNTLGVIQLGRNMTDTAYQSGKGHTTIVVQLPR